MINRLSGAVNLVALTASIAAHALVGALFLTLGPAIVDKGAPIVVEIIVAVDEQVAITTPDPSTGRQHEAKKITATGDEFEWRLTASSDVDDDETEVGVTTVTDPIPTVDSPPRLSSVSHPEPAKLDEPVIVVRDSSTKFPLPPVKPMPPNQPSPENEVALTDDAPPMETDDASEQAEIGDEATEGHSSVGPQFVGSQDNAPEQTSYRSAEEAAITLPGNVPILGETGAAPVFDNPKPRYPTQALARGIQGRVILSVEVMASGAAGKVAVEETSGHRLLDVAAVESVSRWRFRPARRFGVPVEDHVTVPIVFRLIE